MDGNNLFIIDEPNNHNFLFYNIVIYFDVDGAFGSNLYRFGEVDDDVVGCIFASSSFVGAVSLLEFEPLFSFDSITLEIVDCFVFQFSIYHNIQ